MKKEIAKIKPDEIDFKIVLIVIDQKKPLTQSQGIEGYPTSIVFENGIEIWRKKGFMTKEEILKISK
ncbi:MAG: thioredoxin [Cytophagales bacterium]|nr:MAG: thioredoxin [Cytophagales bacterium]